jgi:hypothetical protein
VQVSTSLSSITFWILPNNTFALAIVFESKRIHGFVLGFVFVRSAVFSTTCWVRSAKTRFATLSSPGMTGTAHIRFPHFLYSLHRYPPLERDSDVKEHLTPTVYTTKVDRQVTNAMFS